MRPPDDRHAEAFRGYWIGYIAALALTCIAFAAVRWPSVAGAQTLAIILLLGLAQIVVQFRFFLRITFARSSRADLQLILFSALIVALMVAGTLVILFNLRARMM